MNSGAVESDHGGRRRWLILLIGLVAMTAGCTFQYGLAYLIPALRLTVPLLLTPAAGDEQRVDLVAVKAIIVPVEPVLKLPENAVADRHEADRLDELPLLRNTDVVCTTLTFSARLSTLAVPLA